MPSLCLYADILHHLPPDSWLHGQAEDWAAEWVLLWEGDTTLSTLDLDDPCAGLGLDMAPPPPPVLVLVTGSLCVQGSIFHVDTECPTTLAVLGDLTTQNLMLSGQSLLVTGDLVVWDLFWGDDRHGRITVTGKAQARLWLVTKGYALEVLGGIQAEDIWDDDSRLNPAPTACRAALELYFDPGVIVDAGYADLRDIPRWLDRAVMCQRLATQRAVLQAAAPVLARPERLSSSALSAETLQQLAATPLASEVDSFGQVSWTDEAGTCCYLYPSTLVPEFLGKLYLETPERRYWLTLEPQQKGFWSSLFGRGSGAPSLTVETRAQHGENVEWGVIPAEAVAQDSTLQAAWLDWLPRIAQAEHHWPLLQQEVTAEKLEALLALPYARRNYANDNEGRHFGGYYLALRQREEGWPRVWLGWHGSVENGADGEVDFCLAQFALETPEGGEPRARVYFQPAVTSSKDYWSAVRFPHRLNAIRNRFRVCQDILRLGQEDLEQTAALVAKRRREQTVPEPGWLDLSLRRPLDGEGAAYVQRFHLATPGSLDEELGALSFDGKDAKSWDPLGQGLTPEAESLVLVVDEDCFLPCLELNAVAGDIPIAGYLFRGDLTIESYLLSPSEDYPPALIVLGSLHCPNVQLVGPANYVGGDLKANCLYGSDQGRLTVAGLLETSVVIARNFSIVSARVDLGAILGDDMLQSFNTVALESGETQKKLDLFPVNARAADVFPGELCDPMPLAEGRTVPDHDKVLAQMQAARIIYDTDRLAPLYDELSEAEATRLFEWVFASPRLATGSCTVHQGDDYDGEDLAFAVRDDEGNRYIGLRRNGTQSYEVGLHMDPQGVITAEHYVLPAEGFPDTVIYGEPVADRRLAPMAAKHGFYCALEQLAFLPYRQPLPLDAPVESALSVTEDLRRIDDDIRWYGDGPRIQDAELARLRLSLHALKPKIEALCAPEAIEPTRWLEWNLLVLFNNWNHREKSLQTISQILHRVDDHGHTLRDPHRFLEALIRVGKMGSGGADDTPFVLQLHADAIRLLGPLVGLERSFDLRRAYGYRLHEAKQWAEALACNQALLADVDAQAVVDANNLCALLINLAQNTYKLGEPGTSQAYLLRALELGEAHGNASATDDALFQLGVLSFEGGEPELSKTYFERRLAHARVQNDEYMISDAEESLAGWQRRMSESNG